MSVPAKGKKRHSGRATSPPTDTIIKPSVLKHFFQKPKKHALAQVTYVICHNCTFEHFCY